MEKNIFEYMRWCEENLPDDLAQELKNIKDDPDEIYDRFCKEMAFGTSGLRGKMGAGTNRINSVVLRRASIALSEYLLKSASGAGVVIGYDTRLNSRGYAMDTAEVLSEQGVDVFVFENPTPVPIVSFAIRDMKLDCGIMITASHNPKEYNGYKVYNHFGNQIDEESAREIEAYIKNVDPFNYNINERKGIIREVPPSVVEHYHEALRRETLLWTDKDSAKSALAELNICYTPLNGAGRDFVLRALDELGLERSNIRLVESQMMHDGNFPTCPQPNPELNAAFTEAKKLIEGLGEGEALPDIIIATDPDSDRMGLVVRDGEDFIRLSGNQVGVLMFDYILRNSERGNYKVKAGRKRIAFKSYVSSPLTEVMAEKYDVEMRNVFTGFKNIVLGIELLDKEKESFLFGFEESLGYLYGNYTRDKDGVMSSQMVCLMAAEAKSKGCGLVDRLREIYEEFGFLESITSEIKYKSERDREEIASIMEKLMDSRLKTIEGAFEVIGESKYFEQNMYVADLAGGHRLIVRPSGTELKLKIYVFARGISQDAAENNASAILAWAKTLIKE